MQLPEDLIQTTHKLYNRIVINNETHSTNNQQNYLYIEIFLDLDF